jgi:hypothetical protein
VKVESRIVVEAVYTLTNEEVRQAVVEFIARTNQGRGLSVGEAAEVQVTQGGARVTAMHRCEVGV